MKIKRKLQRWGGPTCLKLTEAQTSSEKDYLPKIGSASVVASRAQVLPLPSCSPAYPSPSRHRMPLRTAPDLLSWSSVQSPGSVSPWTSVVPCPSRGQITWQSRVREVLPDWQGLEGWQGQMDSAGEHGRCEGEQSPQRARGPKVRVLGPRRRHPGFGNRTCPLAFV